MAIVTRYFSTSSAGAADGTTWADRAALFSGGVWSTVITAFNFAGSDSLVARIGPGTYTITAVLNNAAFSVAAPTNLNNLTLHGCDSSGNLLTPPDPTWTSDMLEWDVSSLPVLATTSNIATVNLNFASYRLLRFTGSGRNGELIQAPSSGMCGINWCSFLNSTNNASATCLSLNATQVGVFNTQIEMSGANYLSGIAYANPGNVLLSNVKIRGSAGSAGVGISCASSQILGDIDRVTIFKHAGVGIALATSTSTASGLSLSRCVIANNGGTGLTMPTPATANTRRYQVSKCMFTGNGGWGLDGVTANNAFMLADNRFRDNTSGATTNMGNNSEFNSYTTGDSDANEYVDAASGDFRIKVGAAIHGIGYGVSDQERTLIAGNMRGGFVN